VQKFLIGLVVISCAALAGCDDAILHPGSQLAVESCIKKNASTLISPLDLKERCVRNNERDLDTRILNASTLRIDTDLGFPELNVSNKSTNDIVTRVLVTIVVPTGDGANLARLIHRHSRDSLAGVV
jgi:hypothetical protein